LPKGIQYIALAASSPKPSSTVHTLGNTGAGGMWSYTKGDVRSVVDDKAMRTSLGREILEVTARVIETSNPTNKGDSGGPLVNDDGELVGVTQGGATDANLLSIFIDIQEVKALLRQNKINVPKRAVVAANTPAKSEPPRTESAAAKNAAPAQATDPRERDAESKLRNAQKAITRDKDLALAESFVTDILRDYSDTKVAAQAKALLDEIKKKK
jgi:S1-C subfamily serine protease